RLAILLRRVVTMRLAKGALDVERWGLRVRLHPLDNGCEKNLLFTPQMFDPVERAALAAEIARVQNRPFVFIDIGANVGLYSLFVAARAGSNARILAVEPEPGNFARLGFNLAANPGLPITPLPLALGAAAGEVAIALNRRDRGGCRTRPLDGSEAGVVTRVPCLPLLQLLHERGIAAIDAVKIDVEGAEDGVLAPFLREAPASMWPRLVVIEDSRHEWSIDLFAMLAARGYAKTARSRHNVVLRRDGPSRG
ncbi:MAG TPA: FkbM family methyltransferase, partial [Xanthobacteraceae bacterium]